MRACKSTLIAALMVSAPAAAAPQSIDPPPALASYLHDGVVEPGDYRWLKGRFPGATAAEKEAFVAALELNDKCVAQSQSAMKDKLAAMGQAFDPGHEAYSRPASCRQFVQLAIPANVTWIAFSAALEHVRPYALGVVRATGLAEQQVIDQGDFAEQLRTRPLGEQILRYAWVESQRHAGETAAYSSLERIVYEGIILRALDERDQANTAWLAAKVAQQGWPGRAMVGDQASGAAWLLVQHADANPAFQLNALRLMAPLAIKEDVNPRDLAMLTDRVQLRLSHKQRYGTQWTCEGGKRVPLPLANDRIVTDTLRATAKLDSLQQNAARIEALYGPCQPAA